MVYKQLYTGEITRWNEKICQAVSAYLEMRNVMLRVDSIERGNEVFSRHLLLPVDLRPGNLRPDPPARMVFQVCFSLFPGVPRREVDVLERVKLENVRMPKK